MKEITVPIRVKPLQYSIFIGNGLFERIAEYVLNMKKRKKQVIITDKKVESLYGGKLVQSLKDRQMDAPVIAFPDGEKSKTRATKEWIEDKMLENQLGRDSVVLALGGGVVGDVAGFAAATYMRGVPVIQIPTTVIAQADSSIGGKTAVDVPQGKNLIGAFHQPRAVFIDVETLLSLDEKNYLSGLAEIIKHGIIRDRELFTDLETNLADILNRKSRDFVPLFISLMEKNCKIKNEVVSLDPEEANLRKILNYGHTVGHAIELLSGFKLLHGEAIAAGMAAEAFMSYKLGILAKEEFLRQVNLLKKAGLPTTVPHSCNIDQIMDIMCMDKKARNNKPEFICIEQIGRVKLSANDEVAIKIDTEDVRRILSEFIEGKN
ncbi:MAG: 3-dehydroquinate synthase [Spirochaetales bacterium]|nr:3-dehydroquinate synthase [Spirochaetales bacterium]